MPQRQKQSKRRIVPLGLFWSDARCAGQSGADACLPRMGNLALNQGETREGDEPRARAERAKPLRKTAVIEHCKQQIGR